MGKTALAVALAGEWPIEAVSVDSRQVYCRMDIGTGKPTPTERRALRHHLVDVVEPDDGYDAGRFVRDATTAIADIRARDRLPVLVGGTGLYLRALRRGLAPAPPADLELRRALRVEALTVGPAALHGRLGTLDPATAARLHPRDLLRVTRALEVVTLTGRPLVGGRQGSWARGEMAGPMMVLGLTMARDALYRRLDARVDRMLASGFAAEVEGLLAAGLSPDLPAMQGIGYRHLAAALIRGGSLEDAARAMKRDTRRYAKRQLTWFAREEGVRWLIVDPGAGGPAVEDVKKLLEQTRAFA